MTTARVFVVAGQAQSLTNFRGPLLRSMVAAGHQVMAAAPDLTPDSQTARTLEAAGVKTYDIALSRNGLNPFADLRTLWGLFRLFRRTHPEVLLAYTIKPVIWAGLAARISGTGRFYPLITGLGYAFTGEARGKRAATRKIAILLYRLALRRAAGVIFQNPDDAAEFRSLGILSKSDQKVFVVNGSGVDTDYFTPVDFPDGPVTFVLIARLLGDKGVREFAAAAGILRDRGVLAKFRLVGGTDSNADSIHANEAKSWHESGVLDWRGRQEDVRPEIAAAHVLVLPSYREGTPRSILEAMAMGRPIITTDAPGCRETVTQDRNGLLIPCRDSLALADCMQRFVSEPSLIAPMGQQSRRIACDRYDVHKVNAAMMEIMGLD